MRIEDYLPSSDLERLYDIVPVFESSGGDYYLSNDFANLVEPNDDGTIPTQARFQRLLEIPAIREPIKNQFEFIHIQGESIIIIIIQEEAVKIKMQREGIEIQGKVIMIKIQRETIEIQGKAVKIKMQREGIIIQGEAIFTKIQREGIIIKGKAAKIKMQREGIIIQGEAILTKIQREAIEIQGKAAKIKMQREGIKIQGEAIEVKIQREDIKIQGVAVKIKMQREGIKIQGKAVKIKMQREAIEIQGEAIKVKIQREDIKIRGEAIIIPREAIKKKFKLVETYVAANKKKLSTTLSDYLWPLDEGDTRVEFRSPLPKFESSGGDYLSNDCANLVEPNDDGTIPSEATFQSRVKITTIRETIEITAIGETAKIQREAIKIEQEAIKKFKLAQLEKYVAANKKKKLSTTLSDYLWPSDEGDTQVEFRSPVPEFESSGGDYLSNDCANLVEPNDDGTIPPKATFQRLSKITAIREAIPTEATFQQMVKFQREAIEKFKLAQLEKYAAENKKKKLSTALSDYLWPSDEGDTRVEFRSPVPELPPPGELRFVLSNTRAASCRRKPKADGEYCFAACDDGTVKWIHESECVSQNHVWTVRLFERRVEGVLYLRDELRRPEKRNVYNHCMIIGGNVNGSGTQIIGRVAVEY